VRHADGHDFNLRTGKCDNCGTSAAAYLDDRKSCPKAKKPKAAR
jgi:hypothetical protein